MSDTESFISEVNDEVRRDRFYFMLRRYGWIAALAVVLIVGGAAFNEYRKAQAQAKAQAFGDDVLAAMSQDSAEQRLDRLSAIVAQDATTRAVLEMLIASEAQATGDTAAAIASLEAVAVNGEIPEIYQQIASFKLLVAQGDTLDAATRRQQYEALARPGAPLSLLAQEQLALIDISQGETEAAIERLQNIVQDAGVSSDLQQRALQVIVSLGGEPDVANLPVTGN